MSNPPIGGETRNATNDQYYQIIADAAARWRVPVQILLNVARLESDFRPNHEGPLVNGQRAQGMFQFLPSTASWLSTQWGTPVNPNDPTSAANAAARYIYENATGTGVGRASMDLGPEDEQWIVSSLDVLPRSPANPNWELGVGAYNGGLSNYLHLLLGQQIWRNGQFQDVPLREQNSNYVVRALSGHTGFDQLSPVAQNNFTLYWPGAVLDVRRGSEILAPIGPGTGIGADSISGSEGTNFGPPGGSTDDFITGSRAAGYELPSDVAEFAMRVAPELAGGPQAFPEGNFPWFTPGRISEEAGAILQHHALMPNNLVFDPEALELAGAGSAAGRSAAVSRRHRHLGRADGGRLAAGRGDRV